MSQWAIGGLRLAGQDIVSAVADHSVCTQDRTSCLAQVCEQCIDDKNERGQDMTKIEVPCSSMFSGGPLQDSDLVRYDCAVRLGGGHTATNADGDGVRFGRVEVKSGNTWGTICSTGWDDIDADVLCRSVGYEGGVAKTVQDSCVQTAHADWCEIPEASGGAFGMCGSTSRYAGFDFGQTPAGASQTAVQYSTCNLKIVARAGLFGSESSWQLDPHLNGPRGTFSMDKEQTTTTFDFMPPGVHKFLVNDTGKNGWQPPWERELAVQHPECEDFWGWEVGGCKMCLASSSPVCTSPVCAYTSGTRGCPAECTDSGGTCSWTAPNCATTFATVVQSTSISTAVSCPAGCVYEAVDYQACVSECATCGSACTAKPDQASCGAVTWNSKGNTAQAQCAARDLSNAAHVQSCGAADISDTTGNPPAARTNCFDVGSFCDYQRADSLCQWSSEGRCEDRQDPCEYAYDGVCDAQGPRWDCQSGDWKDCINPLLCDVSVGMTCNNLLDATGDDAMVGSVTIINRVCTDAAGAQCADSTNSACTCADGTTSSLQWIHDGVNNDPDDAEWSYEFEVHCGTCPSGAFLGTTSTRANGVLAGIGCDLETAATDGADANAQMVNTLPDMSDCAVHNTIGPCGAQTHCEFGYKYCELFAAGDCQALLHERVVGFPIGEVKVVDVCPKMCDPAGVSLDDPDGVLKRFAAADSGALNTRCAAAAPVCTSQCRLKLFADLSPCSCRSWTETSCSAPFGEGLGPVWLANVHCSGAESSLCECKQDDAAGPTVIWGAGLWACDNLHSLDAGVECYGVQSSQPSRIKDCEGVCVPAAVKGDGWCDEGEYNAYMNCQQLGCDGGDCIEDTCEDAPAKCASGKWGCDNGVCIEGHQRCDNIPQCGGGDKSDERHCSGVFCCTDGTDCIPNAWRNDGWPDCLDGSDEAGLASFNMASYNFNGMYCRGILPQCDIYMQDRGLSCSASILPAVGCSPSAWGNGQCDPLCGTVDCQWDGGDCPEGLDMLTCEYDRDRSRGGDGKYGFESGQRKDCSSMSVVHMKPSCTAAAQCRWAEVNDTMTGIFTASCVDDPLGFFYNGRCDLEFNTTACAYDNGECLKCSWSDEGHNCMPNLLGDGFCDWNCQTSNCNFDDGDCPAVIEPPALDACPAPSEFLGDGNCDTYFNSDSCGCDLGDCASFGADGGTVGTRVFLCKAGGKKLYSDQVCDGVRDCFDGDDEIGCTRQAECKDTYVRLHTCNYGSEVQFEISGGQRFGDPTRLCTTAAGAAACPSMCLDGGTACTPFASKTDYKLDLNIVPGAYTLHAYDMAGDGWGEGARFSIMQLNPKTNREVAIRTLSATEMAGTTVDGLHIAFDLVCAATNEATKATCNTAGYMWDASVNQQCEASQPCTGTATNAVAHPSCAVAYATTKVCPVGCQFFGLVDAPIVDILAGTDTIELSSDMIGTVAVGQTLMMTDISPNTCLAAPKNTPLVVESVSECGRIIKFSTDISATDPDRRSNCKIITPCGLADLSGTVQQSRIACEAAAGGRQACIYQPENHMCRATDSTTSAVVKTCSDGSTLVAHGLNGKICDGRTDCPVNPSCAPIAGAAVTAITLDPSTPAVLQVHMIELSVADPSIVRGQALRLDNAAGKTCSAGPQGIDLVVASVCGAKVNIKGLTAGDASASQNCVITRTPAPECIEDEMCSFQCDDQPCAVADLAIFPNDPDGCRPDMQGDGTCNPICFTASCNFDAQNDGSNGDCEQCAPGCYDWIRGNGECNPECANSACEYDKKPGKTCTETATPPIAADSAACAAVTGTALVDTIACSAIMTAADNTVAACTYGMVDCNSDQNAPAPAPDYCAQAGIAAVQCPQCSSALLATRTAAGCPLHPNNNVAGSQMCVLDSSNNCAGVSDMVWAGEYLTEVAATQQTVRGTVTFDVSSAYQTAVLSCVQVLSCESFLEGALVESIGRALVVPAFEVSILSMVAPASTLKLAVEYEVGTTYSTSLTALQSAATSMAFAQGMLGAVVHSASSCCPGPTAADPPVCVPGCDGPYGGAAVLATVETIEANLNAPQVVSRAVNWMDSVECAGDADGDGTACVLPMLMDGTCQCDCTQAFRNPLCLANDQSSGDCSAAELRACYSIATTGNVCPIYRDSTSCQGDTNCAWSIEALGCQNQINQATCTRHHSGCEWTASVGRCNDPAPCQRAACAVNEHVVNGECVSCPGGTVNMAGDPPHHGDTPCRTAGLSCWVKNTGTCTGTQTSDSTDCAANAAWTGRPAGATTGGRPAWVISGTGVAAHCATGDGCTFTPATGITLSDSATGEIGFTFESARTVDWPGNGPEYANNLNCRWTITCPVGTTVGGDKPKVEFNFIDIEGPAPGVNDFLNVHDGADGTAPELLRTAGMSTWTTASAAAGVTLTVLFESDGARGGQGFVMDYCCGDGSPCTGGAGRRRRQLATSEEFMPVNGTTTRVSDLTPRVHPSAARRRLGDRASVVPARAIPADFVETATVAPPPPPAKVNIALAAVPTMSFNVSSETLVEQSEVDVSFGGFKATCDVTKEHEHPHNDNECGRTNEDCEDDMKKFMYFIEISQDQEVEKIQAKLQTTLIDQLWIDGQTRTVEIRFATYNGNLGLFVIVQIQFTFDLGGKVEKGILITVLDLELVHSSYVTADGAVHEYGTSSEDARMALEFCVVFGVILIVVGELKDMRDTKLMLGSYRFYFLSIWNVIDVVHIVLYLLSIVYWLRMFISAQDIEPPQHFDWSEDCKKKKLQEVTNEIMAQASMFEVYTALTVGNLFCVLVLVFKFTRFQGKLAVVNNTFFYAGESLFHFSLIFGITIFMFSIMGRIVFGQKIDKFSTFSGAFNSNFLLALGDWSEDRWDGSFEKLLETGGIWGGVFFYSYIFLVFFTMVNFFLAIVMEAYDIANKEAKFSNPVQHDLSQGLSALRERIYARVALFQGTEVKQREVMVLNENGTHTVDIDAILDPRVLTIMKALRFTENQMEAEAGTLRENIIMRFQNDMEADLGRDVGNALIMWYFESVDPGAAPAIKIELEHTHDEVQQLSKRFGTLDEKFNEMKAAQDEIMSGQDTMMKMIMMQGQLMGATDSII